MPYLGFSAKNDITINATSDLELTSDNTTIKFGADDDVTITHDPDDGLIFKSIATADDNPFLLTIQTGETDLAANDVIGKIQFQAPDEGEGTDANLVSAAIQAVAEGDFSSSSNATSLQFMTGSSEAATTKMTILSSGNVEISNGLDVGTITTSTLASLRLKTAGSNNAVALNIEENSGNEGWGLGVNADGDLKFYNSGTGTSTGNSAVTFSDDNKVGIGNSSPSYLLSLSSASTTQAEIKTTATNGTAQIRFTNDARTYTIGIDNNDTFFLYDATGTSSRFVVNSSGNFGIGTTSPQRTLHVHDDSTYIQLTNDTTGTASGDGFRMGYFTGQTIFTMNQQENDDFVFSTNNSERLRLDSSGDLNIVNTGQASLNFTTDGSTDYAGITGGKSGSGIGDLRFSVYSGGLSEAMRIDRSGNLLVGTTEATAYNNSSDVYGFNVYANGQIACSVNGITSYFNRQNSDGTIIDLRKDGSTVGSIGTNAGYVKISSGNSSFGSGIEFHNLKSIPVGANGAASDGTVNLGDTDRRWNNIYLAGGVYVGGTGSANLLDDYEEGTFSASMVPSNSGTITLNSGVYKLAYTKIGRKVHIQGLLETTSKSSPVGTLRITNLPFTSVDDTQYAGRVGGALRATNVEGTGSGVGAPYSCYVLEGGNILYADIDASTVHPGGSPAYSQFYISISYNTT